MPSAAPLPARWAIVGATSAGVIGAIAGLVAGLLAYPPTAWFAVFELGVPATIAGGLVGFVAALIVMAGRRIKRLILTGIRT
jgi:riboflavin transporter FmnP